MAAGVATVAGWMFLIYSLIPWLWGPYATAMGNAGPLLFTRGGYIAISFGPIIALILPLAASRTKKQWIAIQAGTAAIVASLFLGYGLYLHTIVGMQGTEPSIDFYAREVGIKKVPDHVKRAFELSAQLYDAGETPWLPRAWLRVDWPAKTEVMTDRWPEGFNSISPSAVSSAVE